MRIDWDNYRALLIQAGASAEDAQREVDAARAERSAVENGKCPQCHQAIAPMRDQRQHGPTSLLGTWHQVRCSNCGYMADFVIGDNERSAFEPTNWPFDDVDKSIRDVVQVLQRKGCEVSLSDIAMALSRPENLVRCALDMAESKRRVSAVVRYEPHPVPYWKTCISN